MDKLKYVKLEQPDGSYSESIPLAVDPEYLEVDSHNQEISLADYITINDTNISNLEAADINLNAKITNNTNSIKALASGSPKGSYATTTALVNANPETGVYIVVENGHAYSWVKNGNIPIDLGVYESTEGFHEIDTGLRDSWNNIYFNKNGERNIFSSYFVPSLNIDNVTGELFWDDSEQWKNKRASTPDFIKVEPNVSYVFMNEQARLVTLKASTRYVFFYDINKNFVSYQEALFGYSGATIDIPSNVYYVRFCIRKGASEAMLNQETLNQCPNWWLYKVNKSTHMGDYIPGKLLNSNAIDFDFNQIYDLKSKTERFYNYSGNTKNILTSGFVPITAIGERSGLLVSGQNYLPWASTPYYMPIEAGEKYRISNLDSVGKNIEKYMAYYDENYNFLGRVVVTLGEAFQIPQNVKYFRFGIKAPTSMFGPGTDYETSWDLFKTMPKWQIEKGTVVTDYVSPFLITTDNIDFDFDHIIIDPEEIAKDVDEYLATNEAITETNLVAGLKTLVSLNRNGRYPNIGFFTDTHSNDNDASIAIKYMTKIGKSDMMDMCVHGGDVISTYTPTTVDEYVEEITKVINQYKSINDLYFVKGNHDDGHTNTQANDLTRFQYNVIFNNDTIHNGEKMYFNDNDKYGNYYYIDNEHLKLRSIFLDSFYAHGGAAPNFGEEQIRWLAEEALNTVDKDNWTVILYSHYGSGTMDDIGEILKAYNEKTTYSTYDYTNDTCKFVGCICGHNHADSYNNAKGFNVIHVANAFGEIPVISLFTIDTTNHILYETRIGRGSSRSYTYGDNTAHKIN